MPRTIIENQQSALSFIRKLPSIQTTENLHRHNIHVVQHCKQNNKNVLESYNCNKDRYEQIILPHKQQRINAVSHNEQQKRMFLQDKHKESNKRNKQNLTKIEHYLEQKRNQIKKREKSRMEESSIRRQDYIQTLSSSFYHSQDKKDHIRQRQSKNLLRSIKLFEQTQQKMSAAIIRKSECLEDMRMILKQKNDRDLSAALDMSREKQNIREKEQLHKIIKKYQNFEKNISLIDQIAEKQLQQKVKNEQKLKTKIHNKRSSMNEIYQKKMDESITKQYNKIEKALDSKEHNLLKISQQINEKRKLKLKQQLYNSFYLKAEDQKRSNQLQLNHHSSQIFLTTLKSEKQKIHCNNLYDSLHVTHRT